MEGGGCLGKSFPGTHCLFSLWLRMVWAGIAFYVIFISMRKFYSDSLTLLKFKVIIKLNLA